MLVVAHKALYEKHIGPVPPGLQLDHTCKRRECVNPWHLELVTPAVNTRRSRVTKLTTEQVLEMRRLFAEGKTRKQLSTMFPVTRAEVNHIIRRIVWKDI